VTEADVLGEVGRGFQVAMRTFDLFRPSVGSAAIGMAQRALDLTVEHVVARQAFGAPLGAKQAVAHQLADATISLSASRLLVGQAADAYDTGSDRVTALSAMAKLHASEAAHHVIDLAVQLHGAKALAADHLVGQLYAEIRASRIFEGASEVQRDLIARDLFRGTALDHRKTRERG
ncbi:MAG: acyl-CoA dehydrogenase, partial [Actinomycetota bacterium]|nr:acyl-CoA dehydrogenase [Actinomycetota bacterium]